MRVDENIVTFPASFYVGAEHRNEGDGENPNVVVLGFAVPTADKDTPSAKAAFLKRKKTVDDWAKYKVDDKGVITVEYQENKMDGKGWRRWDVVIDDQHPCTPRIWENKLLPGFQVLATAHRWGGHFSSKQTSWRVQDPRGVELEISSGNLAFILDSVGVQQNGIIPGNCIWGRAGARNVLVPENSETYRQSHVIVQRQQVGYLFLKDINRGDLVEIGNETLIYLGSTNLIIHHHASYQKIHNEENCFTKLQRYVLIDPSDPDGELRFESTVKIHNVVQAHYLRKPGDGTLPLDAEDVARKVNKKIAAKKILIAKGTVVFAAASKSYVESIRCEGRLIAHDFLPNELKVSKLVMCDLGYEVKICTGAGTLHSVHSYTVYAKRSNYVYNVNGLFDNRNHAILRNVTIASQNVDFKAPGLMLQLNKQRQDTANHGAISYTSDGRESVLADDLFAQYEFGKAAVILSEPTQHGLREILRQFIDVYE